jgi:hypothetical protein
MIVTPHAAFGYIILKNEVSAGETVDDNLIKGGSLVIYNPSTFEDGRFGDFDSGCVWLYIQGDVRHTNIFTNEQKHRTRGYCNLETPEDVGFFKIDIMADTKMFCISPTMNEEKTPRVPHVTFFKLLSGQSQELPAGTKLFLADGELSINGSNLTGARQIHVGSNARTATAVSDSYGFLFP